jgi:predicted house-cleaning noncanonical NTP pyrophosphatase (MazG superfamily)
MLRKVKTPPDIKNIQSLSYGAFKGVVQILEDVDKQYKILLNSSEEEELKRICEIGYQEEFGWCVELIDSLKRVHQSTENEMKQMKQTLKKAKKQWG